jgi:XRE family transcriptional regulator, stress-response regulator
MVLLRHLLGDALRRLRLRQGRTLREVSATARVSLGYLSEVERGRKEASSELLASICDALGAPLSQVLREVSDGFALAELQNEPSFAVPLEPALAGAPEEASEARDLASAGSPSSLRGVRLPQSAKSQTGPQRLVMPQSKLTVRSGQHMSHGEQMLEPVTLPGSEGKFDKLGRDVPDMVPV